MRSDTALLGAVTLLVGWDETRTIYAVVADREEELAALHPDACWDVVELTVELDSRKVTITRIVCGGSVRDSPLRTQPVDVLVRVGASGRVRAIGRSGVPVAELAAWLGADDLEAPVDVHLRLDVPCGPFPHSVWPGWREPTPETLEPLRDESVSEEDLRMDEESRAEAQYQRVTR